MIRWKPEWIQWKDMTLRTKALPQEPRASIICAVLLSNLSVDLVLEVLIVDKIRAYFPKEETSKSLVYLAGDATCRARP
jgi:hypothetical protein